MAENLTDWLEVFSLSVFLPMISHFILTQCDWFLSFYSTAQLNSNHKVILQRYNTDYLLEMRRGPLFPSESPSILPHSKHFYCFISNIFHPKKKLLLFALPYPNFVHFKMETQHIVPAFMSHNYNTEKDNAVPQQNASSKAVQ